MSEEKKIEYDWPDVGKLNVRLSGNVFAVLRFEASETVIQEALAKAFNGSTNEDKESAHQHN